MWNATVAEPSFFRFEAQVTDPACSNVRRRMPLSSAKRAGSFPDLCEKSNKGSQSRLL